MADLHVSAVVARRALDVEFGVPGGEVLAVLGPNGAGKSTTAAIIAGLLRADRAVVRVGDRTLTDTGRGVFVPVHDRRVGLLQQDPLLFPHLDALGNVGFAAGRGGSLRRTGRARDRAMLWLERLGAAEWAERKAGELSGGQAQRVALARALAAEPEVLVLDEPLAGLDVASAAAIRGELRTVLTGDRRAVLLITHDLLDVVGLADRVMVLEEGRIADIGAVSDVLASPRSGFGARVAGVNLVRGVVQGPSALRCGDRLWHGVPATSLTTGDDAVAVFGPSAVAVFRDEPHGSPRNAARVRITVLDNVGGAVRVRATDPDTAGPALAADITPEAVAEMRLSVGESVWFTVKTQEVSLHTATRAAARDQ